MNFIVMSITVMYFGRLSKIFSFLSQTKCPWWISLLKHGKLLWQFSRLLYENMNNYIVSYFYWFMLFLLLTRTQEKKRKQSVCTGWCTLLPGCSSFFPLTSSSSIWPNYLNKTEEENWCVQREELKRWPIPSWDAVRSPQTHCAYCTHHEF